MLRATGACCQLGADRTVGKHEQFEASRLIPEHVQLDAGSSKFGLLHDGVAGKHDLISHFKQGEEILCLLSALTGCYQV